MPPGTSLTTQPTIPGIGTTLTTQPTTYIPPGTTLTTQPTTYMLPGTWFGTGDTTSPLSTTTTTQYSTLPPALVADMEERESVSASSDGLHIQEYKPTFPAIKANPEDVTTDPGAFIDPNKSDGYADRT